jgi:hypothetical protein
MCRGQYLDRYEVTGEQRQQHDWYSTPNITTVIKLRRNRWAGRVERIGKREMYTGFLVAKSARKRLLGRDRPRRKNIKMDFIDTTM